MLTGTLPEKPYPSALILLALSGAILHGLVKRFPTSFEESPLHRSSSIEIELQRSQSLTGSSHSSYRPAPRFVIAIASILIVVRVELQRQLQRNMECSGSVREVILPKKNTSNQPVLCVQADSSTGILAISVCVVG